MVISERLYAALHYSGETRDDFAVPSRPAQPYVVDVCDAFLGAPRFENPKPPPRPAAPSLSLERLASHISLPAAVVDGGDSCGIIHPFGKLQRHLGEVALEVRESNICKIAERALAASRDRAIAIYEEKITPSFAYIASKRCDEFYGSFLNITSDFASSVVNPAVLKLSETSSGTRAFFHNSTSDFGYYGIKKWQAFVSTSSDAFYRSLNATSAATSGFAATSINLPLQKMASQTADFLSDLKESNVCKVTERALTASRDRAVAIYKVKIVPSLVIASGAAEEWRTRASARCNALYDSVDIAPLRTLSKIVVASGATEQWRARASARCNALYDSIDITPLRTLSRKSANIFQRTLGAALDLDDKKMFEAWRLHRGTFTTAGLVKNWKFQAPISSDARESNATSNFSGSFNAAPSSPTYLQF